MKFSTAPACLVALSISALIGENVSAAMATEGSSTHNGGDHMAADDHAWMDESDASIVAYCARPCVGVGAGAGITDIDPCGDGMGQSGFCTSVFLEDPDAFGINGTAAPDAFLGCTHEVCAATCGTMAAPEDGSLPTSNVTDDGTVCFPRTDMMDGMYMSKDDAELSAVARGCSGSHSMGEMVMVGSTHPACASSYSKEGVLLGTFPEVGSSEDDYSHSDGHHSDGDHSDHTGDHHDDHHKDEMLEEDDMTTSASPVRTGFKYIFTVVVGLIAAVGIV